MKSITNSRLKAPHASEVPKYYKSALRWSHILMMVYFASYIFFMAVLHYPENIPFVLPWIALTAVLLACRDGIGIRWHMLYLALVTISWVIYSVLNFGWYCGGQYFLISIMVLSLFSLYDSLWEKLGFTALLIAIRMALLWRCTYLQPLHPMNHSAEILLQSLNTIYIFTHLLIVCLLFSSNIQESEKQLMLYNRELRMQASTDALTKLYNRRYMLDLLEKQIADSPEENFSIALGDIDLFKRVNDTYGHNCGDEVLRCLAALFKEKIQGKGYVCRWGGEEFFFFFPGMNIDEAYAVMTDMNLAVSLLPIPYEGQTHQVTMTFGMEEYDFKGELEALIKKADDKLYYGKKNGRNQVVF